MTDLVIVPSRGGVFEVEVDGQLVFSKKATRRHAEYDEVLKSVRELRS
ncbi:MAG: Rdx family protein [Actinomycetota bacterium]|nr:Rdx family protein [Actinomycetota bacterium]